MQNSPTQDTIFALASGHGRSGVAVFRISGDSAKQALATITKGNALPEPRVASLRTFHDPKSGELLDRGIAIFFPDPNSFTGEDVVELHTHGGRAVIEAVSSALASIKGVRLAEPGEFSRRAFENGKMDLSEAEAIADLVDAETSTQRRQALAQMSGALGKIYEDWHQRLMRILAYVEAFLDFPEEDLPEDKRAELHSQIQEIAAEIKAHLDDGRRGEILREGFSIAIVGAPNVGKSSLLNALAQRDVAIVSATAGTTRDVIETRLDIGGYPVVIADTAGLRESLDEIEQEGIRRAVSKARDADMKLAMFDAAEKPDAATLALVDDNAIVVVNKIDQIEIELANISNTRDSSSLRRQGSISLGGRIIRGEWIPAFAGMTISKVASFTSKLAATAGLKVGRFGSWQRDITQEQTSDSVFVKAIYVSAKTGQGIEELVSAIGQKVKSRLEHAAGTPPLTRLRHRKALEETASALARSMAAALPELAAEDIRIAMRSLGRITGSVDVEDLLDVIFRDFCVGK